MRGKTKIVSVRFSKEELDDIANQAELHKLDVSTYIRKTVVTRISYIKSILVAKTPCEAIYETKESLYRLIMDLKANKKCDEKGGDQF